MRVLILSLSLIAAVAPAAAGEDDIKLKPGDGAEVTQSQCAACHSLDYIQINSPFPNAKGWEGTVNKMIKKFGADIDEADAKTIIEYLSKNYGS